LKKILTRKSSGKQQAKRKNQCGNKTTHMHNQGAQGGMPQFWQFNANNSTLIIY
jgi:hypothetical protein